ncbi:MAG: B12-binding domain-containing protein [Phycisphaerales bacterium]
MSVHVLSERLFEALIEGNRSEARGIINEQLSEGISPERMPNDLFWPTYEMSDKFDREEQS